MSARPLNIDFRRRRSLTWPGLLILSVGLAAIGTLAALNQRLTDEVTTLETSARRASLALHTRSSPSPLSPAELAHMQNVARQLNLPWDRFFDGIEQAASEDVVLLDVHPDIGKGTVRIGGEARNLYAALRCVEALNTGEVFKDAQLVEHEVNQQNPQAPIRFALLARWKPE